MTHYYIRNKDEWQYGDMDEEEQKSTGDKITLHDILELVLMFALNIYWLHEFYKMFIV